MKKIFILVLAGAVMCCACTKAKAQDFKQHITKEFTLQKAASVSTLTIYNVFGSVKVEGYNGDKVMIEVDETISGKTADIVEQGKQEFKLEFEQDGDTVLSYISAPYDSRPHDYRYNEWHDKNIEYRYKLNYVVKVPYAMN